MKSKVLFLIFAFLATVYEIQAQATLSLQGTIRNSTGAAVSDGTYTMTFKLYTVESGGTAVWSETQQNINVLGGVYSALLGATEPLNAAFNVPYFVGITVGSGSELIPRFGLTSAPYALSLIGQSNIFPSTGSVGIGTKTPDSDAQLHVKNIAGTGSVTVEGTDGAQIVFKKGNNTAAITYDGDKINIDNFNPVFEEGIKLPPNKSLLYNGVADWRIVDTDDFETGTDGWICHTIWNSTTTATFERFTPNTPFSKGYILRPNQAPKSCLKKEIDLTGIPHTMVKVVFTYHFFDTWENWDIGAGGETLGAFAFGAFASQVNPYTTPGQSDGFFQIGWRKCPVYNSDYSGYCTTSINSWDFNARGSMVAQTSLDKLWIFFSSNLNEDPSNESFGISNIEIWVR
jgi:hypothetical protein